MNNGRYLNKTQIDCSVSVLGVFYIVVAILADFHIIERSSFAINSFLGWIWDCCEGWSIIPFMILTPICLAIALFMVTYVIVFICKLFVILIGKIRSR